MHPKLATDLLDIYGSPLYVYDGDRLRETIRQITQAVPYPQTEFKFASVTNGNVALLQIVQAEGWGLHANTPGDIYLGLQAGFDPQQIVYSGSNLNREEMQQVLAWGVTTLNLDSVSQLELCCDVYRDRVASPLAHRVTNSESNPLNLGLRLNLPAITGASRIGVEPQEFNHAIAIARSTGLKLTGIHFYRGTGTNATKAFTDVIDTVIKTAKLLPDWEYLDFGGGFGYPYKHRGAAFDWQLFGREITEKLMQLPQLIRLTIEPGRAVIAGCGTLLTKVVSSKWQGDRQIVGVDTTIANLSVPAVHGGNREILALTARGDSDRRFSTDVCGNTTYSRDYLGKNCFLPALKTDDILAILDVGAYGYAMSSHFLHRPRPAEILLENNRHRLIRNREDYSVLFMGQVRS